MKFGLGKIFEKFNEKKKVEATGYREPSFYDDANKGREKAVHGEDEWEAIKNDPEIEKRLTNQYLAETRVSTSQDLGSWQVSGFENYELEDDLSEFENRDLLKEMTAPYAEEAAQKKERERMLESLDYSLEDFKAMQDAYRFSHVFTSEFPYAEKGRPVGADGNPLTDSEIKAMAEEYETIKAKNKWNEYDENELPVLKNSYNWNYFYGKVSKRSESPKSPDGKLRTNEKINELAKEYEELERNDPLAFAELKVENKEWLKKNLAWRKENWKGREQFVASEKGNSVKYILTNLPKGFAPDPNKNEDYFLLPKEIVPTKGKNFTLIFAALRPPYPGQEFKKEPKRVESSKRRVMSDNRTGRKYNVNIHE